MYLYMLTIYYRVLCVRKQFVNAFAVYATDLSPSYVLENFLWMRRTRGKKLLLYAMHATAYFDKFETNQKQITEKIYLRGYKSNIRQRICWPISKAIFFCYQKCTYAAPTLTRISAEKKGGFSDPTFKNFNFVSSSIVA